MTGSQSIEVPDFDGHGDGYVEVGPSTPGRHRPDPGTDQQALRHGYAIYGAVALIEKPLTFTFEGKHYRRFFPMRSNVDTAHAREFSLVQYSAPPTTEAFWVDTEFEGMNTCVSGGRAQGRRAPRHGRERLRLGRALPNLGRARPERGLRHRAREREPGLGPRHGAGDHRPAPQVTGRPHLRCAHRPGVEDFQAARGTTDLFYQETYARYDVIRWLGGPFSLQLQGWHRRRLQSLGGPEDPWFEGQHITGIDWAPHISASFGVEYSTNPAVPSTYLNGQLTYKITTSSSVGLFVGQRRGSLRCVGGVCRIYPPFEGARLDATVRFTRA